jgi:hypothetical protein
MRHIRLLASLPLLYALELTMPKAALCQQTASTPRDSIFGSLSRQARTRFEQAGVEVTLVSWSMLDTFIRNGANRLAATNASAADLALARQNLNTFVDWMIEVAVVEPNGARVAHESTFGEARRRCPPPKYPFCP